MIGGLTDLIKTWLESPDSSKEHIIEGAELYLRVSKKRIFYDNVVRNPDKFKARLRYELQKIYDARQAFESVSKAKKRLKELKPKVDSIISRFSDKRTVHQNGKRADHDLLPDDIKQLWIDNGAIRLRMRDTHTRMQITAEHAAECNAPDLALLAEELVRLDKLYHDNWFKYDHFVRPDEKECADSGCVRR